MNYPRVIIAATGSGSGKTTITCGILSYLKDKGFYPCSFKCGPDYIDPLFHRKAIGIPSGNLDTFFTDAKETIALFKQEYTGHIAVIEGVMGLYDGIGGTELEGSTYDLAKTLKVPIILVVDARGKGRSLLAEIKGFLDYDENHLIKGVILNKISSSFAGTISTLIENELDIKVVGYVEKDEAIALDSRHLGLVMPEEIENIKDKLYTNQQLISKGIDFDMFNELANGASDLDEDKTCVLQENNIVNTNLKLAVARDEAFSFYYKENLQMLKKCGVEIVEFSPLRDEELPKGISGLLFGGGYPENYLRELEANVSIKKDIKDTLKNGLPVLAECGGFMYLMDSIVDKDGNEFDMVGSVSGKAFWKGKLVRFGYVTIEDKDGNKIKGHEFHYYDTDNNGEDMTATKPVTNRSWKCGHKTDKSCMGFAHLYYPSAPDFVTNFVEAMKNYGGN